MRARSGLAAGQFRRCVIGWYISLLSLRYQWVNGSALAFSGRFARAGWAWVMSVETAFTQGFVVWIDFFLDQ